MKRILLLLLLAVATVSSMLALTANDVRIYINPGHGGWGPNDRPMATISYPMLSSTGRPDTCGFYESNTNLWKGFEMRDALKRMGVPAANITMSRTANGPFPYDGNTYGAYSKPLSVIAAEAEEGGYDMFVSIHSNALTDGNSTNYPLYIYRGTNARRCANQVGPATGWTRLTPPIAVHARLTKHIHILLAMSVFMEVDQTVPTAPQGLPIMVIWEL